MTGTGDYRPPAGGRAVALGEPLTSDSLFVVDYADETYVFEPGSWARFGRDDDTCEIPVWEEVRAERLSRVAGELWVADDQLWVRNLSRSHELGVFGTTGAPVWLPARGPGERGRACSVPTPQGRLATPTAGDWQITTRQVGHPSGPSAPPTVSTARLGPVPAELRAIAAALCAPLLADAGTAATYDEVATRLGITRRQARRAVERLCDHYAGYLRRPRPGDEVTTPSYAYLARLLVNRGLVGRDDVPAPAGRPSPEPASARA